MFESIIGYQLFIFITLVFSRIKSSDFMSGVAIGWTVFTFLMVFASFLIILQLFTIWGTVWLLEQLFGVSNKADATSKSDKPNSKFDNEPDDFINKPLASKDAERNEKLRNSVIETLKKARARNAVRVSELQKKFDSDPSFKAIYEQNEEEFKALEIRLLEEYAPLDTEERLMEQYGISEDDLAGFHTPNVVEKPVKKSDKYASALLKSNAKRSKKNNTVTLAEVRSKTRQRNWTPFNNEYIGGAEEVVTPLGSSLSNNIDETLIKENTIHDFLSVTNANKIKIKDFVETVNIPYLVHFTRANNLQNILENGLMSVTHSQYEGLSTAKNDRHRYDGQLDGTSLSISFPNYLMFYKYRKQEPDTDWAVLLLSPRIMWEKDCAFYRFNAADKRMSIIPRNYAKTVTSLEEMFLADAEERDDNLKPYDPTDPQAEVMIYDMIEPNYIQAIVFDNEKTQDKVKMQFPTINNFITKVDGNLFFPRLYARKSYKGI